MSFNSFHFVAFFIVVFCLNTLLRRRVRGRNAMLLAASYYFYGSWDERFLMLILVSTIVDYFAGFGIVGVKPSRRARFGVSGIIAAASVYLLGVDWQAVHRGDGTIAEMFLPHEPSMIWALALTFTFAIIWPIVFELYFKLSDRARRRAFLVTSIVMNLGLLGVFKYYGFFVESAADLLESVGFRPHRSVLEIVLPVGISFYTFQTLSYTIDLYRKKIRAERSFLNFALFVALFPQLVAGPIERASHLLPQLRRPTQLTRWHVHTGVYLMCWGLFKKVVLADNAAIVVDSVFGAFAGDSIHSGSGLSVYIGVLAFAIQIYCDFSAYTDLARGSARLLGFDLMINFNLPYFASNPSDFWRRWHISLSTWLRDYLYIPLGGSRRGPRRTYINLMLTMLLGGLWHGAAWTFVLWGLFHGVLLAAHRFLQPRLEKWFDFESRRAQNLWRGVSIFLFFQLTLLGWLLFRAKTLDQLFAMLGAMVKDFTLDSDLLGPNGLATVIACGAILFIVQIVQFRTKDLMIVFRLPVPVRGLIYALFMLGFIIFGEFGDTPFIYFQF